MSKTSNDSTIDRYKLAFQEEAREILSELESTLLELNETPEEEELVSKAFRALHTIKGSGSMFGFDEVAAFTHDIENAYDDVRNGRLPVTPELVDLTLTGLDHIKTMLHQSTEESAEDLEKRSEILARLNQLTGAQQVQPDKEIVVPSSPDASTFQSQEGRSDWSVQFRPGPDLLRNGTDPLLLLRELSQLGELHITTETSAIPPLKELDPERCYLGWTLQLSTAETLDAIRDVFIFAEDQCELTIEPIAPSAASEQQESAPEKDLHTTYIVSPSKPLEQQVKFGRRAEDRTDGTSNNIRVPTAKLDQFVDLVGELVTVQARLGEIANRGEDPDVVSVSEEVERLTTALRENSMSIRMLPIRSTFERFRRLIHDLARDLNKEVELIVEGADTELDKTVIDQLNDPLMHLIRNSMDHGIESQATRLAAGKSSTATIRLSARHSGANVLIEVADDGGGIHAEAVHERAIERGLISSETPLTESEVFSLILTPGFSTAKEITDVSGRGVGMDVVRQRVEALRGTIHIQSKIGAGTTVALRLPLTLAIIDGLLVRVGDAYFVLPLANSLECIELTRQDVLNANGKHVANVRGEIIPYIRLRDYFDIRTERPEREQIMIAETEDGLCGFVVDEVLGDHQTVIKNLGHFYRHVQFISGATILGDGTLALILDPNRVVQDAARPISTASPPRAAPLRIPPPRDSLAGFTLTALRS
jgi:two-component system chemotaxis sensor kinase CheA